MRSLTLKLTLAFLCVGVIGVVTFALLVGLRTRTEFDRYLSARDQSALVDTLRDYYAARGSWDGITRTLSSHSPTSYFNRGAVLANASQKVVLGNRAHPPGQRMSPADLNNSTPITVDEQLAGYVLFTPRDDQPGNAPGNSPALSQDDQPPDTPGAPLEDDLLERVASAALTSAALTALLALLVGGHLARTLTPHHAELTTATKAMAAGHLDQRVRVHGRDEIGLLAAAFNQMSADLARASQLRQQMTADLAHDLRTPLTILRGYTEGLKEQRLRGTPVIYGVMHDEVTHLQRLVEDLRTLSLADAGELPLNRRAVDPKALLERTGLAYIVAAEQQAVVLSVDAGEGLPSIAVDTDRMTQVLNNLVSNALRHTKGGQIVLSAQAEGSRVCLRVSDTGTGIAPEHLPFIFDRFYRADPSRQRGEGADDGASGLGLAIAKAIVEAHGGSIGVESTPKRGTTFSVCLPAVR